MALLFQARAGRSSDIALVLWPRPPGPRWYPVVPLDMNGSTVLRSADLGNSFTVLDPWLRYQ